MSTHADLTSRQFFAIARVGGALAFGGLAACTQSIGRDAGGFTFQISLLTGVAFALGAGLAFAYWHTVARLALGTEEKSWKTRALTGLLLLTGAIGFFYPLRFVPTERLPEVFEGLILAILTLTGVGLILWRVRKFLDADSAFQDEEDARAAGRNSHIRSN